MNTSLSNHRQNIEFFKYLCQSIKREGIDALLLWLEDTDFFLMHLHRNDITKHIKVVLLNTPCVYTLSFAVSVIYFPM